MNLKSLAILTDLIFIKPYGEIIERENYWVVSFPPNPNFYSGNFLIFRQAPKLGDMKEWEILFKKELTNPQIDHHTFMWDEEEIGEVEQFEKNGYLFARELVFTATKNSIKLPAKNNQQVEIVPLKNQEDWEQVIQVQMATNPQYGSFYAKQAKSYQDMIQKKLGLWFAAYLDGKVVASLGIFKEGKIGRFQIVSTHPDFGRQGICGTLVYQSALYAFEKMDIETLVMVADENYHAAKIYASVGFVQKEKAYGVSRGSRGNSDNRWIEMIEGEQGKIRDQDIYPKLKNWVDEVNPEAILDIGCGQGICSTKIDLEKREYTGLDFSQYLINRAKDLYSGPRRTFICGNAFELPFPNQSFGATYSIALWHLLSDLPRAIKEMSRVLKARGNFFIITANSEHRDFWKGLETETEKVYLHSLDDIIFLLKGAGLEVNETESFRSFILIKGTSF